MSFLQRFLQAQTSLQSLNQAEHDRLASQDTFLTYTAPSPSGRGQSPSGTMSIELRTNIPCPGFNSGGAIFIDYDLPSGVQASCHPHPGHRFDGTRRRTYLPNTAEGRCLLTRFRYAFSNGFMFRIARSLTTGKDNQVCWTEIPNKTSLKGGPFGFPDPNYLSEAHKELDKLSIPSVDDCLQIGSYQDADSSDDDEDDDDDDDPTTIQQQNGTIDLYPVHPQTILYQAPKCLSEASSDLQGVFQLWTPSPTVPVAAVLRSPLAPPPSSATISAPLPPALAPSTSIGSPSRPVKLITAADLAQISIGAFQPPPLVAMPPPPAAATATATAIPASATTTTAVAEECAICLDPFQDASSVVLISCQHTFHKSCIMDALKQNSKCPTCRQPIGNAKPQGKSPTGNMVIDLDISRQCPGFATASGVITIEYDIRDGIQESYHDHPGQRYDGTSRVTYLPTTIEGRQLLQRLIYAWKHGLTFRIGTSLTTGAQNQVTWTSIHHKTSLYGGPHGFPDAAYIDNCNASLDALHVPPAKDCL